MEGTKEECSLMIDFVERHLQGQVTYRSQWEQVTFDDLLTFLRRCKGRLVWQATLHRNRARQRERRDKRKQVAK